MPTISQHTWRSGPTMQPLQAKWYKQKAFCRSPGAHMTTVSQDSQPSAPRHNFLNRPLEAMSALVKSVDEARCLLRSYPDQRCLV